jgi:hypothetical protein
VLAGIDGSQFQFLNIMSFTMTRTVTETFTLTHAKYLAAKVTADMKRCQQRYGRPSDNNINDYGTELAILLRDGYVSEYEFGYKRHDDERIVSWRYVVDGSGNITADERPGNICGNINITGALFFNYLTKSATWCRLDDTSRRRIEGDLPVQRVSANPPKDSLGYWVSDKTYASTGVSLSRNTFHPFGSS